MAVFLTESVAQRIVDRAMTIINRNVNVMDRTGIIIGSGDSQRLHHVHEGALRVLEYGQAYEIGNCHVKTLKGVQPGINLPIRFRGEIVGVVGVTGAPKEVAQFADLVVMLIGTGTLAGIISNSGLSASLVELLKVSGLPAYLLAPFSGTMMSAATASTTAGTAVASNVFGPIIIALGIPSLGAAAMMHSGATVLDHMPHGSFFHSTGGSVGMNIRERLQAVPYETLIGFSMALTSTAIYGIFQLA